MKITFTERKKEEYTTTIATKKKKKKIYFDFEETKQNKKRMGCSSSVADVPHNNRTPPRTVTRHLATNPATGHPITIYATPQNVNNSSNINLNTGETTKSTSKSPAGNSVCSKALVDALPRYRFSVRTPPPQHLAIQAPTITAEDADEVVMMIDNTPHNIMTPSAQRTGGASRQQENEENVMQHTGTRVLDLEETPPAVAVPTITNNAASPGSLGERRDEGAPEAVEAADTTVLVARRISLTNINGTTTTTAAVNPPPRLESELLLSSSHHHHHGGSESVEASPHPRGTLTTSALPQPSPLSGSNSNNQQSILQSLLITPTRATNDRLHSAQSTSRRRSTPLITSPYTGRTRPSPVFPAASTQPPPPQPPSTNDAVKASTVSVAAVLLAPTECTPHGVACCGGISQEEECSICLGDMLDTIVIVLPCLHRFHEECATKWLVQHDGSCPDCRLPVVLSNFATS